MRKPVKHIDGGGGGGGGGTKIEREEKERERKGVINLPARFGPADAAAVQRAENPRLVKRRHGSIIYGQRRHFKEALLVRRLALGEPTVMRIDSHFLSEN
jgi:hypothetical protein